MPTISVIVPVYRVEKYIHRCVDSILSQMFRDFELILVDDGSPDNCPAICDEYAAKDSRVRVIHQENGGLSAARNAGIDWAFTNSDSRWLTFIDSDDWVHPNYLEALYRGAKRKNLDICACAFEKANGEPVSVPAEQPEPEIWDVETFYVEHTVAATIACAKLYAKRCFRDIRYPIGKIHEDEFVTYRILFAQEQIAFITTALYAYYQNPEGIMKSSWTPKRLDGITAKKEQLVFFQQQNFGKAYAVAAFKLLWTYASQIIQIEESPDRLNSLREMRKKLRKAMRQYRSTTGITIRKNYDLYEVAYPKLMYFYWLMIAALKKLHLRE